MFGLKLETYPDLISVSKLIGDLQDGKSSTIVSDCDLFTHSGCKNSTFCGTCPAAHGDIEQLGLALEDRGFRRKMIFSSDDPTLGTTIELNAPDESGSIRLEIHQSWLKPGVGRPWMKDESNSLGLLIGSNTLSVIASETRGSADAVKNDAGNDTSNILFRLALAEL